MWLFGPHDSSHFLKNQLRELIFREAILAFLGVGKPDEKQGVEDIYCQNCKQAHPELDCSKCSRKIEVIKNGGESEH
jgi:hypothetical protein